MGIRRTKKNNHVPLIVEPHPEDYDGYEFITLIKYRDRHVLTVVDNATDKSIGTYVLDLCTPEGLNEEAVITVISEWYETSNARYPVSIEFSRRGITEEMSKIYRSFSTDFVMRVIGPLPRFNMTEVKNVRRRRKRAVAPGIEVHKHFLSF